MTLESVRPEDWGLQSLCSEWRVRDVVAHVALIPTVSLRRMFPILLRCGFHVDRAISRDARTTGVRPPAELLEMFRGSIPRRETPPGAKPINVLTDTTVHGQDIRRPLGLQ